MTAESRTSSSSAAARPATRPRCTPRAPTSRPLVDRGLRLGRAAPADDRRRELPRLPRRRIMGPAADAEVARPGRALRHALHHRPGDQGRARQRARRHPQGLGRRRRVPGPHRHPRDGRRAQEARRPRRGGARRRAASPTAPPATRRSSRSKPTIIVGGGDSAMEEAIFLSKFASKVDVVHRRDEFRASKIMLERARSIDNIEFLTPYVVEEFEAGDGAFERDRAAAQRRDRRGDASSTIGGAFIAIGHEPQSEIVARPGRHRRRGLRHHRGQSTRTKLPGRVRRRRPRRPHLPPGDHRRRLGLPGRARRRVVPARHAAGPHARPGCPRATSPRRSGPRRRARRHDRQLTHPGPRSNRGPGVDLGRVSARSPPPAPPPPRGAASARVTWYALPSPSTRTTPSPATSTVPSSTAQPSSTRPAPTAWTSRVSVPHCVAWTSTAKGTRPSPARTASCSRSSPASSAHDVAAVSRRSAADDRVASRRPPRRPNSRRRGGRAGASGPAATSASW